VAELVIGPATSGRTRWLANDPPVHADLKAAWIADTPDMSKWFWQSHPAVE